MAAPRFARGERTESMRSRVAMFCSAATREDVLALATRDLRKVDAL